jgi:hypothetical protein
MLALLRCGLSYSEARGIGVEEVLCLVQHQHLYEELRWLDGEAARVASLSFAEAEPQARQLLALQHRARRAVERFNAAADEEQR